MSQGRTKSLQTGTSLISTQGNVGDNQPSEEDSIQSNHTHNSRYTGSHNGMSCRESRRGAAQSNLVPRSGKPAWPGIGAPERPASRHVLPGSQKACRADGLLPCWEQVHLYLIGLLRQGHQPP